MTQRQKMRWEPSSASLFPNVFDVALIIASTGLRQNYRWNYLGSCAYVNGGDGICNSTSFGHAFTPLAAILSDTPAKFSIQ